MVSLAVIHGHDDRVCNWYMVRDIRKEIGMWDLIEPLMPTESEQILLAILGEDQD